MALSTTLILFLLPFCFSFFSDFLFVLGLEKRSVCVIVYVHVCECVNVVVVVGRSRSRAERRWPSRQKGQS